MRDLIDSLNKNFSAKLLQAIQEVHGLLGGELYIVGGTVRNLLLAKGCVDLDVAANISASLWAKKLANTLDKAAIVNLSGPFDETYRVVWKSEQVDISSFRENTKTIEDDLVRRDFTINAMAIAFPSTSCENSGTLIDPMGGKEDLELMKIRHLPNAFIADPVRMLRGYRLAAQFGFSMVISTRDAVKHHCERITEVAVERIGTELALIFESSRTSLILRKLAEDGLLRLLLPELFTAQGVEQPDFHHLDVLQHSFLTLEKIEEIIDNPEVFYPGHQEEINLYLSDPIVRKCLKWAALLHDIGKPSTKKEDVEGAGRITFYGHDEVGKDIFQNYARRSHWSGSESACVARLIGMHMHPFHLCNIEREGNEITKRAALKLCQRAGDELLALFLLAMADSLASKGEKKPEKMEEELVFLLEKIQKIFAENIEPVFRGPKLLTGADLIEHFRLVPGPIFSEILTEFQAAQVEGVIRNKDEGLLWVEKYLANNNINNNEEKEGAL